MITGNFRRNQGTWSFNDQCVAFTRVLLTPDVEGSHTPLVEAIEYLSACQVLSAVLLWAHYSLKLLDDVLNGFRREAF